jgi:SAM-dependent methyltransferase
VKEKLEQLEKLYTSNLETYGVSSQAVGWKNSESQELRFEILNKVIQEENTYPLTVNDYGCGYGAHLKNLIFAKKNISSYYGYDISSAMLEALTKFHEGVGVSITTYLGDSLLSLADYTFVSGTFNVRNENSEGDWEDFIKKKLNEISRHSLRGFSFNLLTTKVDWKSPILYYGDPDYWLDYCRNVLGLESILHQDYGLFEWTIGCIKR